MRDDRMTLCPNYSRRKLMRDNLAENEEIKLRKIRRRSQVEDVIRRFACGGGRPPRGYGGPTGYGPTRLRHSRARHRSATTSRSVRPCYVTLFTPASVERHRTRLHHPRTIMPLDSAPRLRPTSHPNT
ncbi:unnamed protein product [Colias eurytheme]|nr:unnamed protein product [Colias eurytheme]